MEFNGRDSFYDANHYDSRASLSTARKRADIQDIPLWVNIAFGCAVTGGVLGCVALAFKKAIALPILIISLLGILVQIYYSFITVDASDVYGPGGTIMPMMVLIIALFLVWLANSAKAKGWIC